MKTPRVQDFDPNAKIPSLGSPMDNLPAIQKPLNPPLPFQPTPKAIQQDTAETTYKSENLQARLHANQQTSKDASIQASKPENLQVGKHVNLQTGKHVIIEKYSSYLTHEYKRELKRIAFETDRKEYEVLIEAIGHYLENQKSPK